MQDIRGIDRTVTQKTVTSRTQREANGAYATSWQRKPDPSQAARRPPAAPLRAATTITHHKTIPTTLHTQQTTPNNYERKRSTQTTYYGGAGPRGRFTTPPDAAMNHSELSGANSPPTLRVALAFAMPSAMLYVASASATAQACITNRRW